MGVIYLTRHGQTVFNVENRFQGRMDSPLTEKGIRQAEALRDRLADVRIDKIYTSPIKRAYLTASIINEKKGLSLIEEPMLMERNYGEWDGQPYHILTELYGVSIHEAFERPREFYPKGGEQLDVLTDRLITVLQRLSTENENEDILLVSHGQAIRMLLTYLHGYDIYKKELKSVVAPTSLTKIEYKNKEFQILMECDIEHIREL